MIDTPFAYVLRHRGRLARIAGCGLGVVLAPLSAGRFIASAVDAAYAEALAASLAWIGALLATGAVGVWSLLRMLRLAADASADVQLALTRDVVRHSLDEAVQTGQVARSGAELVQHVPVLVDTLALMLRTAPTGLFALGAAVGLATISWPLLALVVPWLALATFLLVVLVYRDTRNQTALAHAAEASYGEMSRAIQGVRDLMAFGAAGPKGYAMARVRERIDATNRNLLRQSDQNAIGTAAVNAAATWLPALTALGFVPLLVRRGLTPGEIVGAFTYLLAGLSAATVFVTTMASYVVVLRVQHGRLLESAERQASASDLLTLPPVSSPDIAVRDLSFSYGASATPIVEGLRLDLPFGDHLAVVGSSGIGKSTLAALLGGVLAPSHGAVEIGGAPLHRRSDRSELVAMVPQESYVFAGSLRDNLTYLRPAATDQQILAAAQAVGLERVLDRLGGLDAEIDLSKSGLSAGERQLVTLARAHLSARPIVILDEATCHLDPAAEERAERAFMETGATLIVVAHRMSATLRAQRVLVMATDGVVVGSHDDSLRSHPLYADLHAFWSPAPQTSSG